MAKNGSHFGLSEVPQESKTLFIFIYAAILIVGDCLCLSIISYEKFHRNDKMRTIVNQIVSFQLCILLFLNTVIMSTNIIVVVQTDGCHRLFCTISMWLMSSAMFCLDLTIVQITALRYFFICKSYNMHLTHENIVATFLKFASVFISGAFGSFLLYGNVVWSVYFGFCLDQDPKRLLYPRLASSKYVNSMAQTAVILFIINFYLLYKIWKCNVWSKQENKFVSWGVQIFLLLLTLCMALGPFTHGEDVGIETNIDLFFSVLCSFSIMSIGIPCYLYIHCKHMRQNVWKTAKRILCRKESSTVAVMD